MEDRSFTLFLEDDTGAAATFEIVFCPDEAAAKDRAVDLLDDRPRYRAVEVFDGKRSFRVERPQA